MTTEATLPSTSASPTARQLWTRTRGIALALVVLLAGAIAIAVIRSDARHGELDPRSADPGGSRAVAELLADRGVDTRVVTTLHEAAAATGPDTTLLVAAPDLLTRGQQSRLHNAFADTGGRTVLVASGSASVEQLAPGVTADPATSLDSTLSPDCDLPAARRAGSADTGGVRYTTTHLDADACYPSERLATLLRVPGRTGNGDTVLLGAPDILLNDRLDEQGNASLALQLLGSRPPSGLVPPLALRRLGHRRRRRTQLLRPAPLGLALGHPATLHRHSPGRPLAGTPARPPRARKTPRRDPRLRNRRRPRPPLPQGRCPRPRGKRSSLHHPHPPRPPRRRPRRPGAHARGLAPRPVRPSPRRWPGPARPPLRTTAQRRRSTHRTRRPTRRPRKRGTPSMM
ncbi:LOW QUALITY PROTEIN: secreted protein, partial [Streptomyces viridochromogenes DSM 40736]